MKYKSSHAPVSMRRVIACVAFALAGASSLALAGIPYTGTPLAVPGTVQAENFDKGGEGVGYHDLSAGNSGGQYRTSESVDIIKSPDAQSGGYAVNNFQTGEWLAYTVNVPTSGTFDIAIRASHHDSSQPYFHVEVDGVRVTSSIAVPKTKNWNDYQWVTGKTGLAMAAGQHVVKLVSDTQYFNLDAVRLSTSAVVASNSSTPYTGSPIALPKAFEAENFDKGGQGVAYYDNSAGNSGGQYRTSEDVDIVTSTDSAGGGYAIVNFQNGEWMAYSVSVPTSGPYDISIRASNAYSAPGAFHVEVDGVDVTGKVSVPITGSWDTFQWVGVPSVQLAAGPHVLKLVSDTQYFIVNQISVLAGLTTSTSTSTSGGTTSTTLSACANPSGGYEGFGNGTTGGAGQSVVHVTNLNDSGTGSLRAALSAGNRCVVFDVGGTINLSGDLPVRGLNVTIDGFTAPSPGITLSGRTFLIDGAYNAGNVILRGIRVRTAGDDTIRVYNAQSVVVDHVSVSGYGDGAIDVTENSRNVTISWNIIGPGIVGKSFASLNKYNSSRITHHHNLYYSTDDRNPFCGWNSTWSTNHETVCDIRNNLIWGHYWYGTSIREGGTANIINNYYWARDGGAPSQSIYIAEGGVGYANGNYSKNGANVNAVGNASIPFVATAPATSDAMTAARAVVAGAGARSAKFGLDSVDKGYISNISP